MHKSSEKIIWAAFFSLHIAISMFHDKASKNLNLPLTSYGGKDIVLGIVCDKFIAIMISVMESSDGGFNIGRCELIFIVYV